MMKKLGSLCVMCALWAPVALVAHTPSQPNNAEPAAPTAEEAAAFVEEAEAQLWALGLEAGRAAWVQANFITVDTQAIAAAAGEKATALGVKLATQAARYDGLELPYDVERKLGLLKAGLVLPAPSDSESTAELARLASSLEAAYGSGTYCRGEGDCLSLPAMTRIMAESRDPDELLEMWKGWRDVAVPMRSEYQRTIELGNLGAKELGFPDAGALWRSKYDMDPDGFAAEVDRLWNQVRPLYDALHCHVRAALAEQYGEDVVPTDGPIPAHVLGNMWAQSWENVYDFVKPENADPGYNLTELLEANEIDEIEMVRIGERFFTSLGFAPLPETFWERSLFVKPADRDVVCHASAWNLDNKEDVRIKMCIQVTAEDFNTIHHELGHNFYQLAYNDKSLFYQDSANDGFHEAVGDTIALSVTPKYLVDLGLLDAEPDPSKDIGLLMQRALDKVAFLPFGLLVDQWRWKVFSGEISPEEYTSSWWELREKYQGVGAPVERSEEFFDPGAKYHVPAYTPYTRYFLAHILQFQFHRSLCEAAGYEGPLNRCSIYGNEAAGQMMREMLAMGLSRPWPDALEAVTGQREMDATAILDYFAPLKEYLDAQNEGRTCGW